MVEIVCVISTEKTFTIAFAYVANFVWVLENLKGLFMRQDAIPHVKLTDRDLAMINVAAIVFQTFSNLLFQSHIRKNVRAKCNGCN